MNDTLIADEVRAPIDTVVGVATAISELARNILRYTACGEIILRLIDDYDWFAGFGRAWAQGALAVSSTMAISLVKATTESGATVLAIARLLDHRG